MSIAGLSVTLGCKQLDVSIASVQVVQRLELDFKPGSFWALLGPNGVGKTTLLNCLAGLRAADQGKVELNGQDIQAMPRRKLARQLSMLQQHSAYVFDSSVLQTALTGRHPHLGLLEREGPADFALARSALSGVDLQGLDDRCVTTLSGGEARRLAFASLLVQQAPVMLLDEPSNHLDLKHQVQIMQMIRKLSVQQGGIAIAALHDVNLAMSYCSHALMLLGSGEWRAGPIAEMLTASSLERIFGCPMEALQGKSGVRFYPLTST